MKAIILASLLFTLCDAEAVTVLLTLTGRVSETNVSAYFSPAPVAVGDPWTVRISYEYPSPAILPGGIGVSIYGDPNGLFDFRVNSLFWTGQGPSSSYTPYAALWDEVNFGGDMNTPAHLVNGSPASHTTLNFYGAPGMVADAASLPLNFTQWNLPAANTFELDVITPYGFRADFWHIKANSFDTISIQVIPEPSAAGFALTIAIAALGRRGRMRA